MNRLRRCWTLGLSIFLLAGAVSGQAEGGLVRSDFDHDCDVDAVDFAHFKSCALRSTVPQSNPLCADARLDADADVDMDDFGIFQRCYSGEGNVANPACDPMCLGPDCNCPCGQTTCNGTCVNTRSDNGNCGACGQACAAGTICQNGTCAASPCFGGQLLCDGVCREVALDPSNCGSCGHVCGPGMNCAGGACQPAECGGCESSCPPGGAWCGGGCIDVWFDGLNCGACGNRCAPLEFCSFGQCEGACVGCE